MIGREGLHREALLNLFRKAGADDPVNHLATGNVSFDMAPDAVPALAQRLSDEITAVVGRPIDVYMRSIAELRALNAEAVFATAPVADPVESVITFFETPFDLGDWVIPKQLRGGQITVFHVSDREVFSVNELVDGKTTAPGGLLERQTGQRATTRAWSTVARLIRLHDVGDGTVAS